ncbi:keratin, type I cytoskeletal 19-like [Anabas testudineus]|uniref:IF rod domain-containing protein n=1 Tax=Anabas testudineus TaxID=64144 RepID=A0A3Q1J9Z1_ANATE|nr:keratin, type I cytoskeletal 19-like [Anabas testudineus]
MPVSVFRQTSSYSSRSISSVSSSLKSEMQSGGNGQSLVSIVGLNRAPSMYGGSGGYGCRISESVFSSGSLITDEKLTMQNLNDRLSSYLDKVRALESGNRKLELQIREFCEKKASPDSKDFTRYFNTISELRAQITEEFKNHQRIFLQLENAHLAYEDFRTKYEVEMTACMVVEAEVASLRAVRDQMTLNRSELEMQIEDMKEELAKMKRSHEKEMHELRNQQTGSVNVEVDSAESVDLTQVLQEMREQYESLVQKKKQEVEKWFQSKVATLQKQVITQKTEVNTHQKELSDLKNTYHSVEISLQSEQSQTQYMEQSIEEISGRYCARLSQLQVTIILLETELYQLRTSIEQQQAEYNQLLDIKMRLEQEIAEYRRLLGGEYEQKKTVVISQTLQTVEQVEQVEQLEQVEQVEQVEEVEEVEEYKPHIERRVKVITEEIVDGVVVASSVDIKVEDIQ